MIEPKEQRRLALAFIVGAILFALSFITLGVVQIAPSAWWEWALVVLPFLFAVSPIPVMAASMLGRLRGNPSLVFSDEGIEVRKGGLWTLLPFLEVPERSIIPWRSIRDVHEHPLGVIVDHAAYQPSLIQRIRGGHGVPGELISLPRLNMADANPYEMLLDWNESWLVDSVRTAPAVGSPSEKVT